MIGYATIKNKDELNDFIEKNAKKHDSLGAPIDNGGWYWDNFTDHFYNKQINFDYNLFDKSKTWLKGDLEKFWKMIDHLESENQKIICYEKDDFYCVIGCDKHKYLMPVQLFDIEELVDYSNYTVSELKALNGTIAESINLPANVDDISKNTLNNKKEELENKVSALKKEAEDIKDNKVKELAKIKEEIQKMEASLRAKQEALMAELKKKEDELAIQKKALENQIFMLDSQIYSIRCYFGEVIDFSTITSGKPASSEEPLIIYQKVRYIDEELGKYVGLYDIPVISENTNTLIQIIKYREDLRELFVPNTKCITILKASRTGKIKRSANNIANVLEDYEAYHGNQMAILVRNNENIYIGWTEEERINLSDENLFYIPKSNSYSEADDNVRETKSSRSDMISRMFIMSIIQGLYNTSNIISLPDNVNIFKPNDYIVFSAAEGWIEDNTYGTFEDILNKANKELKEGDYIFTPMGIGRDDTYDSRSRYDSYNNDRGIGSYNRTHDAAIPSHAALPINKILYDAVVEYTYEKYEAIIDTDKECEYEDGHYYKKGECIGTGTFTDTIDFESWREKLKNSKKIESVLQKMMINSKNWDIENYIYYIDKFYNDRYTRKYALSEIREDDMKDCHFRKVIDAKVVKLIPHYFISTKCDSWYSNSGSYHVNMEIYNDEYYPLAYLCPTWIKYVIKTGNIGNIIKCGSRMNYSSLLRDLNGILEHLNKVQIQEKEYLIKAGLEDWINNTPNWDAIVTEWRIANNKRKLTEANAKTFAKTI